MQLVKLYQLYKTRQRRSQVAIRLYSIALLTTLLQSNVQYKLLFLQIIVYIKLYTITIASSILK